MKKILGTMVVLVLMAVAGFGGYEIGTHKVKVTSTSTAVNTSSSTTTNATTTSDEAKQPDLQVLLANLQTKYPTVQQTYIYSETRDPNGNLGKNGYYTAGAEFYDTRTNTAPDSDAFGADSGGAIEVYASDATAAKRVAYLKQFQGSGSLDPGAAKQVGNVVVRASSQYTVSEQTDIIKYLAAQI